MLNRLRLLHVPTKMISGKFRLMFLFSAVASAGAVSASETGLPPVSDSTGFHQTGAFVWFDPRPALTTELIFKSRFQTYSSGRFTHG